MNTTINKDELIAELNKMLIYTSASFGFTLVDQHNQTIRDVIALVEYMSKNK